MLWLLLVVLLLLAGYSLPVSFRLQFSYSESGISLRLGLEMLHGLLRKEHDLLRGSMLAGAVGGERSREKPAAESGNAGEDTGPRLAGLWADISAVRTRFDRYGLGGTLLSYFIPPKYLPWLHVADRLEHKGRFTRLQWRTVVGLEEAAATAWAAGLIWAIKGYLLCFLDRRYGLPRSVARVGVEPVFTGMRLDTAFDCIFKMRVGYIIRASLAGFILDQPRRSVPLDDRRPSDRGSHEDGDAEH